MLRFEGPIKTWREAVGRRALKIDFTPADDRPAQLCYDVLLTGDDIMVSRFRHSPGASFRDREIIMQDQRDSWTLLIPRTRPLHIAHRGAEFDLQARDATLLHNTEPGLVGSRQGVDYFAVLLPEKRLSALGVSESALVGQVLHRSSEALNLLRIYISCLERGLPMTVSAASDAAGRHISELVALAGTPSANNGDALQDGMGARAARVSQALAFIASQHTNPRLSIDKVAANQRISPRYLHRLFELAGVSFTAHLSELRLQQTHHELADVQFGALTVAEIAYRAGFSDVSHFNRLFRRRFGKTPTGVRSEVLHRPVKRDV